MINEDDKKILQSQDDSTLIQWWLMLNHWEWPDELSNEEQPIYKNVKNTRRYQIMDWIDKKVGHRAISRIHNRDMTDEEFDDFWKGNYEGDKETHERYDKRLRDKYSERKI
jgi:hypothetical protein